MTDKGRMSMYIEAAANKSNEIESKDDLIVKLELLKFKEERAKQERLDCEKAILKAFFDNDHLEKVSGEPILMESNRKVKTLINNREFNLSVKYSVNRKFDTDGLSRIFAKIPEAIRDRLIRMKPEINMTEYKYLLKNEPAIYNLVSEAVIETPAKPYLTLESESQVLCLAK